MDEGGLELFIDGQKIDTDDLTFRENREVRRVVAEEILETPGVDVDIETLPLGDFLPALVYVVKRRTNPEYTLEEALDMKFSDVLRDPLVNGGPPTKAAGKSRAKKS